MSVVRRSDGKARVILPSDFASQLLIIERVNDSELRIKKGRAVRKRKYTFKELVDAITPENRHAEIAMDSGQLQQLKLSKERNAGAVNFGRC